MRIRTKVDIVSGFLGSGKTTFINGLLQSGMLSQERIAVIQCETGEEAIDNGPADGRSIRVESSVKEREIDAAYIRSVIERYRPDRIIIEHNGMSSVEELLNALEDRRLSRTCVVNMVFQLVDPSTFDIFMNNMGHILAGQISNSDLIIINNKENLSRYKISRLQKPLTAINRSADILTISSSEEFSAAVDRGDIYREKVKYFSKPSDKLFLALMTLVAAYFLFTVCRAVRQSNLDLSGLEVFNTIFLSILIQAFPFILIGVFISSIIQVFVSQETIVKFFPRNRFLAFGAAVVSGFLFPVCDCAIVPVAGRLVKKGVPLPVAITFMLAAPIVNPIVIASTIYAFPGQPAIAFYRVYLGITIAVAAGLMLMFSPEKEPVLRNETYNSACRCGCCGGEYGDKKGITPRFDAVFTHAASEFFEVGRFLIVGAFLSAIVQTVLPKDVLASLGGGRATALLIMMASAFVLSICSTSDAFIARTFTSQFSIGPVMGFLVLGPMIDVKNLLMLLGSFRKGFVIKLVFIIFILSFIILYVLTSILF